MSCKPLLLNLALVFPSGGLMGCGAPALDPATLAAATSTASLHIEGMTCSSCAVTVKTALRKLDGIGTIDVMVDQGAASVGYDPEKVTPQQIAEAVTHAGYSASVKEGS